MKLHLKKVNSKLWLWFYHKTTGKVLFSFCEIIKWIVKSIFSPTLLMSDIKHYVHCRKTHLILKNHLILLLFPLIHTRQCSSRWAPECCVYTAGRPGSHSDVTVCVTGEKGTQSRVTLTATVYIACFYPSTQSSVTQRNKNIY